LGRVEAQVNQGADPEIGSHHIHTTRFNLGDVQNRVDEAKQMLSAGKDFIKVFSLFFGSTPSDLRRTMRVKPMMALRGVRNSWLMLAKKALLAC